MSLQTPASLPDAQEPSFAYPPSPEGLGLSREQLTFFRTFGFLKIPGFFTAEIDRIRQGFEEGFAADPDVMVLKQMYLQRGKERHICVKIADRSPNLEWLKTDERLKAIATAVLGSNHEYSESDGSLFWCDTGWHADLYGAPLEVQHLKFSIYLDELDGQTGAIRFIPGSNHYRTGYAANLREWLSTEERTLERFAIPGIAIPSWTVDSTPGDLILWNYRSIHASYGGGERRRLLSMSFREAVEK